MRVIGLTGGIGSGKSEAAAGFREAGIPVIEADGIGHSLMKNDPSVRTALINCFGDAVRGDNGDIVREKLAALVFTDEEARRQLNAIMHPVIVKEVRRQCAELEASEHAAVIVEAALLAEPGYEASWLKGLILLLASERIRVERLVQNRGLSQEDAQKRIAAQSAPEAKIPFADWVINNNGDLAMLRSQVKRVAAEIHALTKP